MPIAVREAPFRSVSRTRCGPELPGRRICLLRSFCGAPCDGILTVPLRVTPSWLSGGMRFRPAGPDGNSSRTREEVPGKPGKYPCYWNFPVAEADEADEDREEHERMREVMPTTVAATFATEMFATNQQLRATRMH